MKEQPAKIMITGLPHTGKSALIKLLDGHPNLAVIHTHDKIMSIFYSQSRSVLQKMSEYRLVQSHPPLIEVDFTSKIAQYEHTIYVDENKIVELSKN